MNLYDKLSTEIDLAQEKQVYNNIKILQSPQGPYINVDNKMYLNMCSNNYLGYANDQITIDAIKESYDIYGVGPGAVRSISGSYSAHIEFENLLAEFKGVESAIVLQSGFQANTSLIPTITDEKDLIISDKLNHASIIDGMRLSKAKKEIYNHSDMQNLENILANNKDVEGNIFIITDGVFSMDGDIAQLDKICLLAKEYGAYTIVDDAHGEGVLGQNGRGVVDHFGLQGEIDIEIGTMSKAFGLVGGFVCGKKILIDYLKQKARPFLFSSGLDMGMCHAGVRVLNDMMYSDSRNKQLWTNAKYLQDKITTSGYNIGNTMTPITPFMVYDETIATTKLTKMMFDDKILVSPIIYPTVEKGKARIRIMVSSLHTIEQLDEVFDKLTKNYELLKNNA